MGCCIYSYLEVGSFVRRHINWNNLRRDLKGDLAHLVQDIGGVFAVLQSPCFHRFEFDPFALF